MSVAFDYLSEWSFSFCWYHFRQGKQNHPYVLTTPVRVFNYSPNYLYTIVKLPSFWISHWVVCAPLKPMQPFLIGVSVNHG